MGASNNFNMKNLQKIELDILEDFISVCKKLDLQYFVIGGTLLGAIRHEGFIPWDDDIDIGMPRPDYERFLEYGQQYLKDSYFLQTYKTEYEYPYVFAKIRDCETTFIEKAIKTLKINHGVYIDIFPLDGYPSNKILQAVLNIRKRLYEVKIASVQFSDKPKKRSFFGKIFFFISDILYKDVNKAVEKYDKLIKKFNYNKSNLIINYGGAWGEKEIVSKKYFCNGLIKKFATIDVVVPQDYNSYLTNIYGNYMNLPPEEKRISHHYTELVDLNKSYLKYT